MNSVETLKWVGQRDGYLVLIDQTQLPTRLCEIQCRSVADVWHAIRKLQVRGAPAIGIAAGYGVCLGMQQAPASESEFFSKLATTCQYLKESRPTAVNLAWAVERLRVRAESLKGESLDRILDRIFAEACAIHDEDRVICHAIGRHGAALVNHGEGVLTHCNAGGLATSEFGTALAVIFAAHDHGKRLNIFVDETRPLLQGSRLTAWELMQHGIKPTLICDSMAAQVMREGRVQHVIVGADRIAANGDTANKIGTYGLAVLASAHKIPFYVAAPTSTFDLSLSNGDQIPIEQRDPGEITDGLGRRICPEGIDVYNPAFDVTPARYIHAIVTERGIVQPVDTESIKQMLT